MKKVQILVRKELLDILRDKKTLVMMVAVPMLLYPLIIIGMALFFSAMYSSKADQVYCIGYEADEKAFGEELERVLEKHRDDLETEIELVPLKEQENCAAWLEITGAETGVMRVTIHYTSASQDSRIGKQAAEELLELYRAELVRQRLEAEGLEESILHPVEYEAEDGATLTESMGMDMGGSIGLMLIATILLGAMYPAIDATAGEKERGTLETLLTLPVTNFQMILSKYISVALFTCVTAILSLLSLGGSVLFLMYGIADVGTLPGLSLTALLGAVPVLTAVLLVTALFCSALCMCFCVFAKSFKEANNYVTPVLLAVMFASMAGMLPTVVLDSRTALIPVVNVSLLVKQLISGHLNLALAGIVIGVNLACSILIIWVLAKLYDSETVLFGEGFGSFRIFQKRSEIQGGNNPGSRGCGNDGGCAVFIDPVCGQCGIGAPWFLGNRGKSAPDSAGASGSGLVSENRCQKVVCAEKTGFSDDTRQFDPVFWHLSSGAWNRKSFYLAVPVKSSECGGCLFAYGGAAPLGAAAGDHSIAGDL